MITKKWCTSGPASLPRAINKALLETYKTLKKENGTAKVDEVDGRQRAARRSRRPAARRRRPCRSSTRSSFNALGLITQPLTTWQNRPTFQQVIQFPAHRRPEPVGAANPPNFKGLIALASVIADG